MSITSHLNNTYLILGGARSGKSSYAEGIAQHSEKEVVYIATARILDKEIQARVERHRNDRPAYWRTVEEPIELAKVLQENASANHVLLVDCLTMWLTNLLTLNDKDRFQQELDKFHNILSSLPGDIIFVSNEVGMGIIPMGELTREYVDEAGRLHQQLAQQVDHVILMVAGLPLCIKGNLV